MKKLRMLFVVMVLMGLVIPTAVYAASEEASAAAQQEESVVPFVDVGNKICPLTGENVDGESFYIYKGRRYGLCCQQCADNFAQNPETLAAIAEKEVSGK